MLRECRAKLPFVVYELIIIGLAWAQQAHTMLSWLMLTHLGHMIFLSFSRLARYLVFTKIWIKQSIRVVVGLELWLEKSFTFSATCGWKDKKIIESVGHTKVHLALIYLSIRTVGKAWNKINRVRRLGCDHDLASNTFGAGQCTVWSASRSTLFCRLINKEDTKWCLLWCTQFRSPWTIRIECIAVCYLFF